MKHFSSLSFMSFGRYARKIIFALSLLQLWCSFSVMQAKTADETPEPMILMKTNKLVNEEVLITLVSLDGESSSIQIDWGDGVLTKEQTGDREIVGRLPVNGATIKVYGTPENIRELRCSKNALISLNVTKLTKLEDLFCDDNLLIDLDVSNSTNLKQLCCQNNQLASLDIKLLTQANRIYCYNNKLVSLDVSKCQQLSQFDCSNNLLTSLILKGAISLDKLTFSNNMLTKIDISGLVNVSTLRCENNLFTSLDLMPLVALGIVYCRNNPYLVNLEVKNHQALKSIYASNSALTSLDVSGIAKLSRVECDKNDLESLIIDGNPALTRVICDSNFLKINTLPYPAFSSKYTYAPQKEMEMPFNKYYIGDAVDLNEQYKVSNETEDVITSYIWKKKDGTVLVSGTDYSENQGVFTFNILDSIYCEMANVIFPDLILKTENICIVEHGLPLDPIIEMSTSRLANEEVKIILVSADGVPSSIQIDWGDGTIAEKQTGEGEIIGVLPVNNAVIKIYGNAENVGELKCTGNALTSLEVSKLSKLKSLLVDNNSLTNLEVNELSELNELCCQNNQLISLNVNALAQINKLDCYNNELKSLDISKNPQLMQFDCSNNKLTSLNLKGAISVEKLTFSNNLLTEIDLSGLANVTTLRCDNNLLVSLDLMPLTSLETVYCRNNYLLSNLQVKNHSALKSIYASYSGLTSLDVSGIEKLASVECDKNNLTNLIIEHNPALTNVLCDSNSLKLNTLPYPEFSSKYKYAPQKEAKMLSKKYYTSDTVDLSDQLMVKKEGQEDAITTYAWKKVDGTILILGKDYVEKEGKFTFNVFDSIYCEMTNPIFPELILKTENIHIEINSSILNYSEKSDMIVYINFLTSELNIEGTETIVKATVWNLKGDLISNVKGRNLPFDMSHCSEGVYIVSVETCSGVYTYKVINK